MSESKSRVRNTSRNNPIASANSAISTSRYRSVNRLIPGFSAPLIALAMGEVMRVCYNRGQRCTLSSSTKSHRENSMGKGNNSQKNDKKNKKPKKDKKKEATSSSTSSMNKK